MKKLYQKYAADSVMNIKDNNNETSIIITMQKNNEVME